jgi:spore cortex formation protein SpoVR/YcgB (stage V sporulation)
MAEDWQRHISRIEQLAREKGLNYHRVEFEVVPESFMTEIAIYGLPVRMPHWSFGVRYIYQLIQHRMGLSRLFEVVFPGNPGRAYLAKSNSAAENVLVTAHVLGHADFSANNMLFRRSQDQVGEHIVEQAAAHARHGDRRARAGARGVSARRSAVARTAHRYRSGSAPRALSRAGGATGRTAQRRLLAAFRRAWS